MTICPHCKTSNNNFYYCKGCGRKITSTSKPITVKKASSPKFTEEVIEFIENNFSSSDSTITRETDTGKFNLGEKSQEDGIFLIEGKQWAQISTQQQCKCFSGELLCIYIITAIITTGGFISGVNDIEILLKLYASAFLAISFISWFIVPYCSGLSPISLILHNCSLFTSDLESVKHKAKELIIMFFASSLLYIFIFPFFILILKTKFAKNYLPGSFQISNTNYLKKHSA